jgi:tape measure domain-containing protein
MATRQDQILRYGIDVASNKPLLDIALGLDKIVESGGPAAEEAKALQEQLAKLAQQGGIARALVADKAALQETGDALTLAKLKVQELQAQFAATDAPTAAMTRAMEKATASVTTLESQYNRLSASIATGTNALRAANIDTNNLDAAQRGLQASLTQTAAKGVQLAASFHESSAAAKEESLSLAEVTERNLVLRSSFEQLAELLKTFAGLFALEKVGEELHDILNTGDKFAKWGVQFSNAFGGAEKGQEALEKIKVLAEQTPLSLDDVAKAALTARKVGLDPLDGSLLSLINTTVKFGGGAQELETLITALGKSANQGGLNLRTLIALEQLGIPAAQLLGDAIGKTSTQVTELAKEGKLGADSVQTLIAALGRANTGAIADQMGLLSTQTTKAKDNFDEFLNLIAKSGAYDFVRDQLKSLNEEFKKGLEDGSLAESAKSISDGLIKIGQALINITRFATEHAGAIVTVVEQYALFKAAMLALDLIGAAKNMLGLAAATEAVGVSAATAAGEQGVGKLSTALGKIPRNIGIAIALAGVADILVQLREINDIEEQNIALHERMVQLEKDDSVFREKLLQQAKAVATQNVAAAQTEIATATQLAEKNREQSDSYVQALQSAIKYFTAIKVQDQALGNTSGAKAAGDKIRELVVALQEAQQHQAELTEAIAATSAKVSDAVDRFDRLKTQGVAAAEAIKGAFEHIDLANPEGFRAAVAIIEQVSIRSKEAAAAVRTELLSALSKLNDADLHAFQENVTRQLAEAKGNADALKLALGGALQEELLRLGLSAEQVGAKFTVAGQAIIASFAGIATNAQATGEQIQLAFAQALTKVTTTGEVEALKAQLEAAFRAGKLGADQFGVASAAAGRRLAEIQTEAAKAGASLDGMGKTGETAAQRISSALQDTRDKLVVQANQIASAITAALQAGDTGKAESLRAQFKSVDSQIQDLNTHINSLTPSFKDAGNAGQHSGEQIAQGFDQVDQAAQKSGEGLDAFKARGTGLLQALDDGIKTVRDGFAAVSDEAAKAFDASFKDLFDLGASTTGTGADRVMDALAKATARTTEQLKNSNKELQDMIGNLANVGQGGTDAFGNVQTGIGGSIGSMQALKRELEDGTVKIGLLGKADLAPLEQALDAAISRAKQLADQAKAANDQLDSMGQSLQDELDQQLGNLKDVEDRRFQKQLDDLKKAATAAGKLGDEQYQKDLDNAKKLHDLKLRQIEEEEKRKNGKGPPSTSGSGVTSSNGDNSGNGGGTVVFGPPKIRDVHIHFPDGSVVATNQRELEDALTRVVVTGLKRLQGRTVGDILR